MVDLQNSLTGSTLAASPTATPAEQDYNNTLDQLFSKLEEANKAQSANNQQVLDSQGNSTQQAITSLPAPKPMPVPATPSGPARAIATFGAGLGASLTRQPAMLQNVQQQIGQADSDAMGVQKQNYAVQSAFDRDKQGMLLSHQVKLLELKAEEQIKSGDRDGALQTLKAQTVLAEKLRKVHNEENLKNQQTLLGSKLTSALTQIGARGDQARKTQEVKDKALSGGMDKSQLAEFTQRAQALRGAAAAQIQDLQTLQGGPGADSDAGAAALSNIQLQLEQDIRNTANEIRQRGPAKAVAASGPATVAPADVPAGNPNDLIRKAYRARQATGK